MNVWNGRRNVKKTRKKGIEVKKKLKVVEAHFDDCGTDLSGLGSDTTIYLNK